MKLISIFLITLILTPLIAESQEIDRVEATIKLYPETFASAEKFSQFLSRDFSTDEEKVRAIYTWLIQNVEYDPKAYKLFNYSFKNYKERNSKEEKNRYKIIAHTLKNGKAVCEGYAMTFEKLLQLQGIDNYLIRGDTKTNFKDIGRKFNNNHMWNAVKIDGNYYLFDATWGAGKYTNKFIKEPTYTYYRINPNLLLNTHLPQQLEDTFTENSISKETFFERPLIIFKSLTIDNILTPKNGIISELDDGNINFKIETNEVDIDYSFGNDMKQVLNFETISGTTSFSIPIELGAKQLLIYFNGKPALGYRIKKGL